MSGEPRGATAFWTTVRLLLVFAWKRTNARGARNRQLLSSRGGSGTAEWGWVLALIGFVFLAAAHAFTAQLLPASAAAARALDAEAAGTKLVSSRTLERLERIELGARHEVPWKRRTPQEREASLREAFREDRSHADRRERQEREQELFDHYERHGRAGLVVGASDSMGTGTPRPLVALLGSLVIVAWFAMLVLQGEGLAFDLQRRRHPMWEWVLSHPIDPRAVFLAEMLAPLWANPFFATAPVFWIAAFSAAYGLDAGFLPGLMAGISLSVAASCLSKAIEVLSFLTLPVRSRGAVVGLLAWIGQASYFLLIVAAFSPGFLLMTARWLVVPAASLDVPLLAWALGLGETASAWKGATVCVASAVVLAAVAAHASGRATRHGLAGAFSSAAKAPAALASPRASRWLKDPLHRKELLWLWRDRGAVIQVFLVPLTLAAVQLFNFRWVVAEATRGWHVMAGASVLVGTYFLSILGPRSLVSEGAALWIPLTWPRGLEDLLRAKARLWWVVSCVVVGALLLAAAVRFPAHAWKVGLVGALWLVFAASMAERMVTLVTVTTASGEPEPVPRGRRFAASLGTLTFAAGVLSQQWSVAVAGVVFSWLTTAALWQNFRARLPYLFDSWSERLPTPPTVLHAMVAISAALEVMAFFTAVVVGFAGIERLWFVRSLAYGVVGLGTAGVLSSWLSTRGVWAGGLWHWSPEAPVERSRVVASCAAGAASGLALGAVALGYTWLVARLPESVTGPGSHPMALGSEARWWLFIAVAVLAPVGEEYLFRGLLFRSLEREWGLGRAVLGSACFFAIYHQPYAWLPVGLVGVASALLFRRTGHLAPSVVLHMAYNAVVVWML